MASACLGVRFSQPVKQQSTDSLPRAQSLGKAS